MLGRRVDGTDVQVSSGLSTDPSYPRDASRTLLGMVRCNLEKKGRLPGAVLGSASLNSSLNLLSTGALGPRRKVESPNLVRIVCSSASRR